MVKRGFSSKRDEATRGWTKLHNLEVINYIKFPNFSLKIFT